MSRRPDGSPEIFSSIQGEGVSAGLASTFIRLAGCNLHCVWCDTKYTWDWARYDPKVEVTTLSVHEVEQVVRGLAPRSVIVTGGEPLLQQRPLAMLLTRLANGGFRFEVETNGTIVPADDLVGLIHQWNVSPKLSHAGDDARLRDEPDALMTFAGLASAFFKFVVREPSDLSEVEDYRARYGIPPERTLLMPEGTDAGVLLQRSQWLAEECTRRGYRLSPRLHIILWGDERGR